MNANNNGWLLGWCNETECMVPTGNIAGSLIGVLNSGPNWPSGTQVVYDTQLWDSTQ